MEPLIKGQINWNLIKMTDCWNSGQIDETSEGQINEILDGPLIKGQIDGTSE